jgi:hypothetical protein
VAAEAVHLTVTRDVTLTVIKLQDVLEHGDKQVVVTVDLLVKHVVVAAVYIIMVAEAGRGSHLLMVVTVDQAMLVDLVLAAAELAAVQTVLAAVEATLVVELHLGHLAVVVEDLLIMDLTKLTLTLPMVATDTL